MLLPSVQAAAATTPATISTAATQNHTIRLARCLAKWNSLSSMPREFARRSGRFGAVPVLRTAGHLPRRVTLRGSGRGRIELGRRMLRGVPRGGYTELG